MISSLYGHVRKLIRHTEGAEVVEMAYNDYANLGQRTALVQEFYGTEFALFKDARPEGTESHLSEGACQEDTPSPPKSLGEILTAHPVRRKGILSHMRDSLLPLLSK